MATPAPSAPGTIYDIGYRHYEGERLGRPYAVRSLIRHGLRVVFAFGRGPRARLVPLGVGAIVTLPAIIQAAVAAMTNEMIQVITYSTYFLQMSLMFALFCAAQAPELVSADQRTRSLVLYLARALRRSDYVLAKVAALAIGVFFLALVPLLILFAGHVFAAATPWDAFKAELPELAPIVGTSLMVGILMGSLSVAISSLTPRRAFATAGVIGYFLVVAAVVEILREVIESGWDRWLVLLNPFLVLGGFVEWVFKTPQEFLGSGFAELPGWTYVAGCLGYTAVAGLVLWARYRKVAA